MTRRRSMVLLFLEFCLAYASCRGQDATRRFEFHQPQMGTEFTLILYTADEALAKEAADAAFARIAELNAILSDYEPESEAMRLCASAGGEAVALSKDLYRVLHLSIDLAAQTDGAFDPTVGPVVRLWRRARRTHQLPNPEDLAKARSLVNYRNILLYEGSSKARLLERGMKLDFGGIAKGYAADEALKVLKQRVGNRVLVAAAGDIVCGDPPPGEPGWKVEVAALKGQGEARGPSPVLLISNRAVSTSGDTEQFVEIGDVRYSHIVNPRTGLGVVGRSSVTVVADCGAKADSLATAASVLGPQEAMRLINATEHAAALFVTADETGFAVVASNDWNALPKSR